MSEHFDEPTVNHELIPCVESLDSIHCDKTDQVYVEGINLDSYINSSIDIGEPIENCEDINCLVLTEKSGMDTLNNKELDVEDVGKQTDDKLMDIDNENIFNPMNIDATGSMDAELSISVSDDRNKIMDSNSNYENAIEGSDQVTNEGLSDLSAIDVLENIGNNDSNELNEEGIDSKVTTFSDDKIKSHSSVSEEHLNQSNLIFDSESYQEQQVSFELNETPLKTNSRPQRQAAKKAENQIREIAKEIIKPLDSVDENIIDTVVQLPSPLKKVCSQCNRFRLCKFIVKGYKSMYLCQEDCTKNYRQKNDQCYFEIKCEHCNSVIMQNDNKNYFWQTKHFCSISCLSRYQNIIFDSNCISCQKPIKLKNDSGKYFRFISGKILQFCDNACSESYESRLNVCSFCQKELVENVLEDFCSSFCQTKDYESRKKHLEPDSSIIDCGTNKITRTTDKCNVCFCKLNPSSKNEVQIFSSTNFLLKFCSKECSNKSIVSKKRMVSCTICKVKKLSYDMISTKNVCSVSPTYVCSLNCARLFQQLPQSKLKKIICDKCGISTQGHFKTFLNGIIYHFCSRNCSNSFESNKKQKTKSKSKNGKKSSASRGSTRRYTRREENNLSDSDEVHTAQQKISKIKNKVNKKLIPEDTNVLPTKIDKEVQTDQTGSKGVIIPVPVPVYIPMPMHMYVMPYPVPVPFPIPLPVPIFIPTTKNTYAEIMKDIKKIREETPDNPFEADLLLIAGMVADDQKNENNLSLDSENNVANNEYSDDTRVVSSSARNHNSSFGDDVFAMALNMAGTDAESLAGVNDLTTISSNNEAHQIIDDVEANLVTSTIMPQTPDPLESITQENMISSPQDLLNRPPRKRAPRSQSQRNSNSKRSRKIEYSQSPFIQSPTVFVPQNQQQVVQNSMFSIPMPLAKPDANMYLKYTLGVNAWRQWAYTKSIEFEKTISNSICGMNKTNIFKLDLLKLTAYELNYCLCLFVKEVRKPNGSEYAPDTIYYLCLGIQQYLFENGRIDNIFTDLSFEQFTYTLNEVAKRFTELYNDTTKFIVTRVEEEYLWESKQLGAHSPCVLLCTLIFFNTKHFNLTTVDEHMQLSFSHIMKHWKRNPNQPSTSGVKAPGTYRNVLLRFYPPQASIDFPNSRKKKVYEQHENEENPLRCPVKLYEFYLSKCPESVKTRNDLFYLTPERSCVPDSPVWYSTSALNKESIEKMLNRVKMVKEVNVALLSL